MHPENIRWLTSHYVVQGRLIHDIIDKQVQLHYENRPMDLTGAMHAFFKERLDVQKYW